MQFRLRIARAIVYISLIVILTAISNEGLNSYRAYRDTRTAIENTHIDNTEVIAAAIAHSLNEHGLDDLRMTLPDIHAKGNTAVLKTNGQVVVTYPKNWQPTPVDQDFLDEIQRRRTTSRFLQGQTILQAGVAITGPGQGENLVVMREVDLTASLVQLRNAAVVRFVTTLLIATLSAAGLLWMNWRWAVRPMRQIAAAARQATGGDFSPRLEPMQIVELENIGQGFNSLLERISAQTEQLEALNRNLEGTIEERTNQLGQAYHRLERQTGKLNRHTAGLEALNRILSAASTKTNLQELVEYALGEIAVTLGAGAGGMRIHSAEAFYPLGQIVEPEADSTVMESPIITEQGKGGCVWLSCKSPDQWDNEDRSMLRLTAQQLGVTAQRIQAFEQSRASNRLMSRLIHVSELLNQQLEYEDMIAYIGGSAIDLARAEAGMLLRIGAQNELEALWHRGLNARFVHELVAQGYPNGAFPPPGDSTPALVAGIEEMSEKRRAWWQEKGESFRSLAILPLYYESRLSAVTLLFYHEYGTPGLSNPEILAAFARQASIAMENARLIEAERRQRELAQALLDVATLLSSTLDPEEIFERILANLERVVRHDAASIMLARDGTLQVVRARGYPGNSTPLPRRVYPIDMFPEVMRMSQTGLVSIIPDTSQDPNWVNTQGTNWIHSYAGAPVKAHGTLVGVVNLIGRRPGIFSPEQAPILQAFADHAALALENAQRYQDTLRNLDETGLLYRALTELLTPGGNTTETGAKIVAAVTTQLRVGHCAVALVNFETNRLEIMAESGTITISKRSLAIDGEGIAPLVARSGEAIYIPDVTEDPRYFKGAEETRSEFVLPLKNSSGAVFAVLNMESDHIKAFPEGTRSVLTDFSLRAALVLENSLLLDDTRKRFEISEKLRLATANLTAQLDYAQIGAHISDTLPEILPCDTLAVYLLRDKAVRCLIAVNLPLQSELDTAVFSSADPIFSELCQQRRPVVLADAQKDPRFKNWGGQPGIRSWVAVPLFAGEEVFGAIEVGRLHVEPFTPNEILLLQIYASQVGIAMRNAALREMEQQLAITDPLTSLYNRRGFFELARHELERSWRFYRPLGLLMADIDHFKKINDTHGHFAGDAVLVQLSQTMRDTLREVDLICRFGGEEFCVMLPESDPKGAWQAAERLRAAVEESVCRYRDLDLSVTISIGLANLTDLNQNLDDLIENADRALLSAKAKGRNRIIVAGSHTSQD
jgi:diguanylate cyclase (GGDEF)-like protein